MAKTFTKEDVVKAWSEHVGREDQYEVREVQAENDAHGNPGQKQTWLVDKTTGSVTVAVNGTGADALRTLMERKGDQLIDDVVTPKESTGDGNNAKRYTERGALQFPTQPENVETAHPEQVEVDPKAERRAAEAEEAKRDRQTSEAPKAPKTARAKNILRRNRG